ncbi:MAG: DUF2634 domain-containing protein [bacterium]
MSIFPFITPITTESQNQELEVFKEYAYDFDNNCLKFKNNTNYLVEKNEALKIWIYKALHTERFRFIAYTHDYGNEVHTLISKSINNDIIYSEIKRFICEALLVNPYIVELTEFEFQTSKSYVKVSFYVKTIYGSMSYFVDWGDL